MDKHHEATRFQSPMQQVTPQQIMQAAIRHHQAGNLAEAEKACRQVLSQQPKNADALHMLGVIALQVGKPDLAVELLRQAIAIHPAVADFHVNLANALRARGLLSEAIAADREAIRLNPRHAQARNNLANSLYGLGRLDEAIAAYRQALQVAPGLAEAHHNLGRALADRGLFEQSIEAFRQAVRLKPDYVGARNNMGNALRESGRMDESIAEYRQAIQLQPDDATYHNNLGIALRESGLLDDAVASFRTAIGLSPGYSDAHNNLGIALRDQGLIDESVAACRQAVALNPASAAFHSNLVLILHYHQQSNPGMLFAEARQWARVHGDPLKKMIVPHTNDRSPQRRLKIGYVSPDFRAHPVGRFMLPLLANHDAELVEIHCYAQVAGGDQMTDRLRGMAHQWRNTVGMSDAQMAEQIRTDKIDILIDLAAHTGCNRLQVFAQKPAPVQATYLAYASTTGLDTIDYRITDPFLDPPDAPDDCYSEKSIRIESYWCYQPPLENLEPAPLPAAEAGVITFGCLNAFCKVSPEALHTWCEVLSAVGNSRLILHVRPGSQRDRLRQILHGRGIDPDRLSFAGKLSLADYMAEYGKIDIGLDPFPYTGGTTTCDALWMGVPIVTLSGPTGVGRGGVSILGNVGLNELIAADTDKYVRIAAELAGDLPRLQSLRAGLQGKMRASPLMDAPRFARGIEAVYRRMWRNWCEGK
jgi:protein O-GlcNAc transferase